MKKFAIVATLMLAVSAAAVTWHLNRERPWKLSPEQTQPMEGFLKETIPMVYSAKTHHDHLAERVDTNLIPYLPRQLEGVTWAASVTEIRSGTLRSHKNLSYMEATGWVKLATSKDIVEKEIQWRLLVDTTTGAPVLKQISEELPGSVHTDIPTY